MSKEFKMSQWLMYVKSRPGLTLRTFYAIIIFSTFPFPHVDAQGSSGLFKGKITDDQNSPLAGASVWGKSGTVNTNNRGEFQMNAKIGDTLTVSYVGYETGHVVVLSYSVINLSLNPFIQFTQ